MPRLMEKKKDFSDIDKDQIVAIRIRCHSI